MVLDVAENPGPLFCIFLVGDEAFRSKFLEVTQAICNTMFWIRNWCGSPFLNGQVNSACRCRVDVVLDRNLIINGHARSISGEG